jgi:hypothetical protein
MCWSRKTVLTRRVAELATVGPITRRHRAPRRRIESMVKCATTAFHASCPRSSSAMLWRWRGKFGENQTRMCGMSVELVCPAQLSATKIDTRHGIVAQAPDYTFEDATFKVALRDRKEGTFKETLRVRYGGGVTDLEVPVVWSRVGFLSPSPAKAYLGARPARVFLRCPDEAVELTRVTAAPKGVRAVVTSPREVSISLTTVAPLTMDDMVTVETTLQNHAPLKIPVIRFAMATNVEKGKP